MTALARCLAFAKLLMKSATAPHIAGNELPRKPTQDTIRHLRNEIEHYDKAFANGDIPAETMPMPHGLDDGVELNLISVGWSELDGAVRKIHALTARLIAL